MANSWYNEIESKFKAGIAHTFVLHGNTKDHCNIEGNYVPLTQALGHLMKKREAVILYNRSSGWRFRSKAEEKVVQDFLAPPAPPGTNPLQAAAAQAAPPFPKAPAQAMAQFEKLLKSDIKIGIVFEYAESVFASSKWDGAGAAAELGTLVVSLLRWAKDEEIHDSSNPVILICADSFQSLHPSLRSPESKCEPIMIPYPKLEERLEYIRWYVAKKKINMNGMTHGVLAHLTAGLSLLMIEDILLRSSQEGAVEASFVKERKDEIIRSEYNDVLEIVEPEFGFDVIGGYDYVIDFFKKNVVEPLRNGDVRRCPIGVLMTGAEGTGKSIMAEAVAKAAGLDLLKYNPGKSMGKQVGDSEQNTDRVFQAIENNAPCLVFIDETDKAVGREDSYQGDSGVNMRIRQRLQDFMSDPRHRGRIVFLGATNRPDNIDAAMKRAGRFDKKIPFVAPNKAARAGVFTALFKKHRINFKGKLDKAVEGTDNYVGADIEAVALKAWELAEDDGKEVVTEQHLAKALEYILPSVSAENIAWKTALAIAECNDLSLLPPEHRVKREEVTRVIEDHKDRKGGREL